jgi:tRNA G18 (ribose-2'-O)-methylase SpoU
MRGFFGVAVYQPKNKINIGTLWRTANVLGADFIATIGQRYKHQASDTYCTPRHIPLFEYKDADDFYSHLPYGCQLVGVEMLKEANLLENFKHPTSCVYLLGAEDNGLPSHVVEKCHHLVKLRGERSLNVATAGSIVLYSRIK